MIKSGLEYERDARTSWGNNQQSPEYYNNLAWSGGMLSSDSFKLLGQERQDAIMAANIAEGNAMARATGNAKGTKCNQ